jgi:hypothetical protein
MFTEAFLNIQEILDRNYLIEKEWRDFFFKPSSIYSATPKIKNTSSL